MPRPDDIREDESIFAYQHRKRIETAEAAIARVAKGMTPLSIEPSRDEVAAALRAILDVVLKR